MAVSGKKYLKNKSEGPNDQAFPGNRMIVMVGIIYSISGT